MYVDERARACMYVCVCVYMCMYMSILYTYRERICKKKV